MSVTTATPPLPPVTTSVAPRGKTPRWMSRIGWAISALPILMTVVGGTFFGAFRLADAQRGSAEFGFPSAYARGLILTEVLCGLVYAVPRTAVLGAILLTGYLGGATATHVRAGDLCGMWGAVGFGVFVWLGLFLRDARLRALLPLRRAG